ncbi:hypothetical protein KP509_10G038700 [Ceratopteris richardii]|uniref:F-box domain-containing protein n=1 Tax=Ceratopteris richardii TaxID=49495 RepID=A0A8T2U120_CERRI|nr:hypothetical protein KP509_10G038700 [Ceratopteris richardii]
MESLELLHLVFARLEARDLAMACCCSRAWNEAGSSNHLWRTLCVKKWPGCEKLVGKKAIADMGGYKVFYGRRAMASMGRTKGLQAKPWLRLEHLTFFVDLTYKGSAVISEALPGTVMKAGDGLSFAVRIEPSVVTEAVLPRQALTPFFYQGQLYYEQPFQAVHASDYWLNWSVVRSTDHRMACLLDCAPLAASSDDFEMPWGPAAADAIGAGDASLQRSALPLLFQGELSAGAAGHAAMPGGAAALLQCHSARLLTRSPFVSFGCLDCRPLWGNTLSHPMQFKLVELHLGVWQRCHSRPPLLDSVLLTLEQLDWK